ncbi:MAG: type II toxin-antitoxin system VapC family toxin [Thermoprotei archaeon]|nr:MAG: type II toxin-antitoxin system VapC family toxin [Thermoprotei archaeon]
MRTGGLSVVVDSYAWVEYFGGTRAGERVKELLAESERVYTPSIVLAEVARKYIREGLGVEAARQRVDIVCELSTVVGISPEVAVEAGRAYLELLEHARRLKLKARPGLADAIVLATARVVGAKVLTGDEHFKGLKETIWVGE